MGRVSEGTLPSEVIAAAAKLGENIRAARARRGLTQGELAKACNITRKTLYSLEKGAPGTAVGTAFTVLMRLGRLDEVQKLADAKSDPYTPPARDGAQPAT